jgi:hypothetical protein
MNIAKSNDNTTDRDATKEGSEKMQQDSIRVSSFAVLVFIILAKSIVNFHAETFFQEKEMLDASYI